MSALDCWPVDDACLPTDLDEPTRERASLLAVAVLRRMTAYQVGNCPVTVRPAGRPCYPGTWTYAPVGGGWMHPAVTAQGWVNVLCGHGETCGCPEGSSVLLEGPVASVEQVYVDGVVLSPALYRLEDDSRLVRLDGQSWPRCQDFAVAPDAPGAFSVRYVRGVAPDSTAQWMAGLLAAEYAKACQGRDCALPARVTSLVRQGVTMDFDPALLGDSSGIPVVDAWVRTVNPFKVTTVATVHSPDRRHARVNSG